VLTDVSEERIASIFRVEEKIKSSSEEPAWAGTDRLMSTLFPRLWIFFFLLHWRWRRYVPPKLLLTQYLHGSTPQKMACLNSEFVLLAFSLMSTHTKILSFPSFLFLYCPFPFAFLPYSFHMTWALVPAALNSCFKETTCSA
jgi:hypothetical protein